MDAGKLQKLVDEAPSLEIMNAFLVTSSKLDVCNKALCNVSGGSDSDIMVDILSKVDTEHKCEYVFYDTGLEYAATKAHIKELERKYDIHIDAQRALLSVPASVQKYGVTHGECYTPVGS